MIDLAVVGAGVAGSFVAHELSQARPNWSIALFERTDRVGGRLHSVRIAGLDDPIELGGMRYYTSHRHVHDLITALEIPTHPFGVAAGPDRSVLRGRFADGSGDPASGAAYDLSDDERGLSPGELVAEAFERIVPGAGRLDEDGWVRTRATHRHRGHPLVDWSIGDALSSVLSPEGHRLVIDAFGYDSGLRGFNAGDSIPYMLGSGHPGMQARVPDEGMDRIPRTLVAGLERRGGVLRLRHELREVHRDDGLFRLHFTDQEPVLARRVVLALPAPALRLLVAGSPPLTTPVIDGMLESVDLWQAAKLYLWFDSPWWRDGFLAGRTTTDLPPRKLYYFDSRPTGPAALLAAYTDGRDVEPWATLADGAPAGSAATVDMLVAASDHLRALHPSTPHIPPPVGSAFIHWGADPHETGWHYWRAGARSDAVIAAAPQPDPGLDLYVCGEAFSRSQAWVEGALETGASVVSKLLSGSESEAGT